MKYKIRQKIFSLGDNFTVKNEYDEDILTVAGKIFSLGNKLKIYDLHDNELFYIEQRLFKLLPEYFIYKEGSEVAHLKKEFSFFKPKININSYFGTFSIEGDVIHHNFFISQDGIQVAEVSKKLFSFTDDYTLELFIDNNTDFLITLVIVIDQILHDNNNN
jgi:uncharacterized protein YxjI